MKDLGKRAYRSGRDAAPAELGVEQPARDRHRSRAGRQMAVGQEQCPTDTGPTAVGVVEPKDHVERTVLGCAGGAPQHSLVVEQRRRGRSPQRITTSQ